MTISKILRLFIAISYSAVKTIYLLSYSFLYFLFHPSLWFRARLIYPSPPCLQDPAYGDHSFVTVNNNKLHCVSSGANNAPLLLLLHGFPEFWYSWRFQIIHFKLQYRVVAVDLKGYGESDKPPQQDQYGIDIISSEIIELVAALGYTSCVLIGHDWGGAVAWQAVFKRPDLFSKLIILSCPLGRVYFDAINRDIKTSFKPWYMLPFQIPWFAENWLSSNDYLILKTLLLNPKYGGMLNGDNMSFDDLQAFLYTFSQPAAFTCPLNYYRRIFKKPRPAVPSARNRIKVPTLVLFGDSDKFFSEECKFGYDKYVEQAVVQTIQGSHWLQQDSPGDVNKLIQDFLPGSK
ncbi:Epoxide hydrolase 4 [Oopsacas minuta]|uniref:Epoxide hydrolase 4 n=1 Tax=Oopsacas minuta TaxID=111878 RepID=A0AAV7JIG0_9METZ|nr:Epoxide hydrolase 4 [Oopsacas minuta]